MHSSCSSADRRHRRPANLYCAHGCELGCSIRQDSAGGNPPRVHGVRDHSVHLHFACLFEIFGIDKLQDAESQGAQGFTFRVVAGGFSGAAIGLSGGSFWLGLLLGVVGAVIWHVWRSGVPWLSSPPRCGKDLPAAAITADADLRSPGAVADRGLSRMKSFDAIVVGAGSGRAAAGRPPDGCGHVGCLRRTQALRRHLREHRLHADQDDGRERVCGVRCAAGGGVRRHARQCIGRRRYVCDHRAPRGYRFALAQRGRSLAAR